MDSYLYRNVIVLTRIWTCQFPFPRRYPWSHPHFSFNIYIYIYIYWAVCSEWWRKPSMHLLRVPCEHLYYYSLKLYIILLNKYLIDLLLISLHQTNTYCTHIHTTHVLTHTHTHTYIYIYIYIYIKWEKERDKFRQVYFVQHVTS